MAYVSRASSNANRFNRSGNYDTSVMGNKTPKIDMSQQNWDAWQRGLHNTNPSNMKFQRTQPVGGVIRAIDQTNAQTTAPGSANAPSVNSNPLSNALHTAPGSAPTNQSRYSKYNRFQYPTSGVRYGGYNYNPIQQFTPNVTNNYFDRFQGLDKYRFGGRGFQGNFNYYGSPYPVLYTDPGGGFSDIYYKGSAGGGSNANRTQQDVKQAKGMGGGSAGDWANEYDQAVDAYIDELMASAQGQRDLVVKQLDADHKMALGTDDRARAEFFEAVADKLEQRIGRIPYDYEKYTTRELEDYARTEDRLSLDRDQALSRLFEDENVQGSAIQREAERNRQTQAENLNARGILSAKRDSVGGLAGQEVGRLEGDIGRQYEALNRQVGRQAENTELGFTRGIEDATRARDRNLSDIQTKYRRAGIDAQQAFDEGKERADFQLNEQKKSLERQRKLSHQSLGSLFNAYGA